MDTQGPLLQQSENDGTRQMKRRRPALSCVECRKRKVKCDREKPCGPCARTKSPTCTYRPLVRGGTEQVDRVAGGIGAVGSGNQDAGSSRRSTPSSSIQSDFDSMANRYISPGLYGGGGEKGKPPPLPSESLARRDDKRSGSMSELVDRVKYLEGRLAHISGEAREYPDAATILPIRGAGTKPDSEGQFVKSKFYGQSHWNNCVEPYSALSSSLIITNPKTNRTEINKTSELYTTVLECKHMARKIKASRTLPYTQLSPEVHSSIPSKDVCDELIDCYLRTFEGLFRVLHVPNFRREYEAYWTNPAGAKPSTIHQILVVCAIGVPFYTGPTQPRLRVSCTKWLQATESYLSAPYPKSRLNLAGLQIQILLLLARQVCSVDGDLIWITAGTLLRSAMHLGLHRDPSHYEKITPFHGEMRRRLWATVLEITVQSSLDMGMPPMISTDDYDTRPPSNINDEDLSNNNISSSSNGDGDANAALQPRPATEFTQCSIQIAFRDTFPIRLEITRLLNNLHDALSYDETLRLGADLLSAYRQKTASLQAFLSSASSSDLKPNPFQLKLFDVLVRRFFLCLHRPYFSRAMQDPKYYYSRKICLDMAAAIAAPATPPMNSLAPGQAGRDEEEQDEEEEEDDWTRLTYRGVGFLKSFFMHSRSVIYLELVSQLEEQEDAAFTLPLPHPPRTAATAPHTSQPRKLTPPLDAYRSTLVAARHIATRRLQNGETNAKGTVWTACALARIDALAAGANVDDAILAAAKATVREAKTLMANAYYEEHGESIDLEGGSGGGWTCPWRGREFGRGDGADDVTGVPGGEQGESLGWGGGMGMEGTLQGGGEGGGGGAGFGGEDMDWERLMRDESLDFGWGFGSGVEGSPESWFGFGEQGMDMGMGMGMGF